MLKKKSKEILIIIPPIKEKEQRNTNNNTTNYQVNSTNIENSENHFGVGYEEAMSGYDNENKSKNNIRNNYKNLKAVWLIKLLSLLCILFTLFNSLQRADFLSAIVGIVCFAYIFPVERKNMVLKVKIFGDYSFWFSWLLFLISCGFMLILIILGQCYLIEVHMIMQ